MKPAGRLGSEPAGLGLVHDDGGDPLGHRHAFCTRVDIHVVECR